MEHRIDINETHMPDEKNCTAVADVITHVDREKKIGNPTIAHLLRSARRIVEDIAWKDGLVWYPGSMSRHAPPSELANTVYPDQGSASARACTQEIRDYTGEPFTESEARDWLAGEIDERLFQYVIGARNKIEEVRLVVTEESVEVRAQRPDTTLTTVGPLPGKPRYE
jgi:hypothetical protein